MKKFILIILSLVLILVPVKESKALYTANVESLVETVNILQNNDIFTAGRDGKYAIISDTGTTKVSGTWIHGSDSRIKTSIELNNGNIFIGGYEGKWQIINTSGANIANGEWSAGSDFDIKGCELFGNGNIFIHGGARYSSTVTKITILNTNGTSVYNKSLSFTIANACESLTNGNIFFGGSHGRYVIITATGTLVKNTSWAYSGADISDATILDNGNIAIVGDGYYQIMTNTGVNVSNGTNNSGGSTIKNIGNNMILSHGTTSGSPYYRFIDYDFNSISNVAIDSGYEIEGIKNSAILGNGNILLIWGKNYAIVNRENIVLAKGSTGFTTLYAYLDANEDIFVLSGYSSSAGYSIKIKQVVDLITDLSIDNVTANTIEVSYNHNPPDIKYVTRISLFNENSWSTSNTNATSKTFTGLIPDSYYKINVQPRISSNSIWYDINEYTIPALPSEINTPHITQDTINLFWSNRDNPVDSNYTLQRKLSSDTWGGPSNVDLITATNISQYEDTGLIQDEQYTYRIRVNAKNGNYYYSADYETFTTADPAVAAAEAARSMAEAAAQAADQARDATIESRQYSLEARDSAIATYELVEGLNLDARLTSIENGSNVPPMIKSVKTMNNATLTRTGDITIVINAINGKYYRAGLSSGAGEWTESNTVTITGLNTGVNTIHVQVKNTGELTDTYTLCVFYMP